MPFGDKDATDAAFREADVTIKQWMVNHRLVPNAMEPRGVVANYDPGLETLTVWSSTQVPHLLKSLLSGLVRMPEHKIRVIAPEVGGGFGSKIDVYAEDILVALASIHLRQAGEVDRGRARRTSRRRSTAATSTPRSSWRPAATASSWASACSIIADIGAYQQLLTATIPTLTALMLPGLLQGTGAATRTLTEVYTNKTPTDAYRGAGRPEAAYFIERAMDMLAHKLNMDPAELRRRNFIDKDEFPYATAAGLVYDSGDYEPAWTRRWSKAGYADLRREQAGAAQPGPLPGHRPVDLRRDLRPRARPPSCRAAAGRRGTVRVERSGKVTVLTGTSPHGQGGETSVRPDRRRGPRRAHRRRDRDPRRYGPGALRHRHLRQPRRRGRRHGADDVGGQGQGEGEEVRRPHAGGAAERHRLRRTGMLYVERPPGQRR